MNSELVLCAKKDFDAVNKLMDKKSTDEYFLTIVCYLYQQSIEKLLKALIEMSGSKYPFTHDLVVLYSICIEKGYDLPIEIEDFGAVITTWEARTRYSASIKVTIRQLEIAESIYRKLLSIAEKIADENSDDSIRKVDAF